MDDSKHIERYWSDLLEDEYIIFIYEALPKATVYTRCFLSPSSVIENYVSSRDAHDWIAEYDLNVSKLDDFPMTYCTKTERCNETTDNEQVVIRDLETYEFTLTKK
jgi:hypothetical protein